MTKIISNKSLRNRGTSTRSGGPPVIQKTKLLDTRLNFPLLEIYSQMVVRTLQDECTGNHIKPSEKQPLFSALLMDNSYPSMKLRLFIRPLNFDAPAHIRYHTTIQTFDILIYIL